MMVRRASYIGKTLMMTAQKTEYELKERQNKRWKKVIPGKQPTCSPLSSKTNMIKRYSEKIKVKGGEGGFRECPSPQIRLLIGGTEIGE